MPTFSAKEKILHKASESAPHVQQQAKICGTLQAKDATKSVIQDNRQQSLQLMQLKASLEEEDKLAQHKFYAASPSHALQLASNHAGGAGKGLPDKLQSGMEALSGMSLDHVNVHYNSSKPAAVQAHAYAQGSDIHLASGQEKHLPHELGHVVQQAEGRVKPTTSVSGMAVNDNAALENEADQLGEKALQFERSKASC